MFEYRVVPMNVNVYKIEKRFKQNFFGFIRWENVFPPVYQNYFSTFEKAEEVILRELKKDQKIEEIEEKKREFQRKNPPKEYG